MGFEYTGFGADTLGDIADASLWPTLSVVRTFEPNKPLRIPCVYSGLYVVLFVCAVFGNMNARACRYANEAMHLLVGSS